MYPLYQSGHSPELEVMYKIQPILHAQHHFKYKLVERKTKWPNSPTANAPAHDVPVTMSTTTDKYFTSHLPLVQVNTLNG